MVKFSPNLTFWHRIHTNGVFHSHLHATTKICMEYNHTLDFKNLLYTYYWCRCCILVALKYNRVNPCVDLWSHPWGGKCPSLGFWLWFL
ncbi:hypothetical protein GDO78_006815 [Eleutherodactylus coqui]|uniref:Uncharacterized protein n=1 Tax=Eleutherodactylus coqui TaxID=57060 RepID=A0A8J6KBX4_ELECQ|nr:hypothetical protein GDO78_006815 [Eleutherodactylus coqui]